MSSTGRSGGQAVHWLKEDPKHEAQSAWQVVHDVAGEPVGKDDDGHVVTHWPDDTRRLFGHVRQFVAEDPQVLQDWSQAATR